MTTQAPLIPSLYALLPSSLHATLAAQLSLISLHAEPFKIQDDIFISTQASVPGERTLRLRTQYHSAASSSRLGQSTGSASQPEPTDTGAGAGKGKGKGKGKGRAGAEEKYSLAYVSAALSGREYGEMNVRAVQGMDVAGMSSKEEICEFIEGLGLRCVPRSSRRDSVVVLMWCRHSHSYTRSGTLFYIPLPHPTMTLRLSITHIVPVSDPLSYTDGASNQSGENNSGPGATMDSASRTPQTPYLVQLSPSRSVQAVPQRGEPSLTDVMRMMRDVASRVEMLDWGTGREP